MAHPREPRDHYTSRDGDERSPASEQAHAPRHEALDTDTDAHTDPEDGGRRRRRAKRYLDPWSFPASLGWTVAGTVLPGLGLLQTRFKKSAILLLALALLIGIGGGLAAWLAPQASLSLLLQPGVLTGAWVAVIVFGIVWVISLVVTHLSLRPSRPTAWQRLLGAAVVGILTLAVTVPSFVGARTIHDTATFIDGVFGQETADQQDDFPFGNPTDPWANKPRLNVLVLGGDSGQSRAEELGARTDTIILASIDTTTGDTVLFSLPRQTENVPFPPGTPLAERYPNGFPDMVNALYDTVPAVAPELLPAGVEDPGAEVLKIAIGEAFGLEVDHYAMVNMDGFIEFVNALGGITVNINRPVPVGGNTTRHIPPDRWLPPGPNQHLNGWDALWYARGRYGIERSDYDRMARQRCVIQAVVDQANPTAVLANYEALSKAGRNIVASDVPSRRAPAMIPLALRVKDGTMTSVSFENEKDGFLTGNPDWTIVRAQVQAAINPRPSPTPSPAAPTASDTATPSASPSGTPTPDPTPSDSASPTPTPEAPPASVVDECAYNPEPLVP